MVEIVVVITLIGDIYPDCVAPISYVSFMVDKIFALFVDNSIN